MKRDRVIVREMFSGISFLALSDRENTTRLHIDVRWGVALETAIAVFFDPAARRRWLAWRRAFETENARYVLAWTWDDADHTRVFVITCIDKEKL